MKIYFILAYFLFSFSLSAKSFREEHSPLEDPATDVPRNYQNYKWVVTDKIGGQLVGVDGAPVVRFVMGEPKVMATVPTGTEIKLTHIRTFRGINYWSLTYQNDEGKEREGWISGLLVQRK